MEASFIREAEQRTTADAEVLNGAEVAVGFGQRV
jgi:hypothetical protein